jgi:hypothetical protein
LGNVLGQLDGFFHVGELRFIWDRSLIENHRCGCGVPFSECGTWRKILERAYGSPPEIDGAEMVRLRRKGTRTRHLPLFSMPGGNEVIERRLKKFLDHTVKLYRAIEEITGSRIIVDSSKAPSYAKTLTMLPAIDLYLLHVVRDPRGAAYSGMRHKYNPDTRTEMIGASPLKSSLLWGAWNFAIQTLGKERPDKYLRVRYEDFVDKPEEAVGEILELVKESAPRWPFGSDRRVELGAHHTVSGNPNRFDRGNILIQPDEEWKLEMKRRHRWLVTLNTWPFLRQYGYSVK